METFAPNRSNLPFSVHDEVKATITLPIQKEEVFKSHIRVQGLEFTSYRFIDKGQQGGYGYVAFEIKPSTGEDPRACADQVRQLLLAIKASNIVPELRIIDVKHVICPTLRKSLADYDGDLVMPPIASNIDRVPKPILKKKWSSL